MSYLKQIFLFFSISLFFVACNSKADVSMEIKEGDVFHLFTAIPPEGTSQSVLLNVGKHKITCERIDLDAYEVQKINEQFPNFIDQKNLPDSVKSRLTFTSDGQLSGIRFKNGVVKTFSADESNNESFHFDAYFPTMGVVCVANAFLESTEINTYNLSDGETPEVLPSEYSPSSAYCCNIVKTNDSLMAYLSDEPSHKIWLTFNLNDLDSGFSLNGYNVVWIDKSSFLLKVEANNQEEDQYWKISINQ